ncbi:MAG: hypothetical protein AMXMBFR33_60340 [Candidatus Xenobia bacterium]
MPAMRIRVEFVDVSGKYQLPVVDVESDQLPASFELHTVMHLGELDFQVMKAEPADFRKTGSLRLELLPIESVDPGSILFSLPTLSNELPPAGEPWKPQCLGLHEDDWRQIELLSEERRPEAEREMDAIRRVKGLFNGTGYPELHVRQLAAPLEGASLRLTELASVLPAARAGAGICFREVEASVSDGFAWRTQGGLLVFGTAPEGRVHALCIEPPGRDGAALAELARRHGLVLADWCATRLIEPGELADFVSRPGGYTTWGGRNFLT